MLLVEQNQGLAEASTTDREIGLYTIRGTLREIERGVELEHVDERVEEERLAADRKYADRAVDFFQGQRFIGAGDYDTFPLTLRRLDRPRLYLLSVCNGEEGG